MKPQSKRLKDVHARALTRFNAIYTTVRDEREQCLEDRRFYSVVGAQWEGGLGEQFENKPMFEMNKVHLAVIRVVNEYRNNRITVDFTSKDGVENDKLADACDGLYRADEQDSGAQEAYDNAFEEAAAGGFGAWRLRARYEDDDDEDDTRQRIDMEPIHDADSCVFFDLNCKRQDKRNAKFCFVLNGMTRDAYKEEYDDSPEDWGRDINRTGFDWAAGDVVYVAEYYEVEEFTELMHVYRGLALGDDEPNEQRIGDEDLMADDGKRKTELEATGFREVRQKRITRKRIHKYQLSGGSVLKDEGIIAGRRIPIIPVFGKRWFVDGVERLMGHVRLAKDAQRLKNMLVSWLADISSKSPVSKPIVTPEQMLGHTSMWSRDNVDDYPYLMLNGLVDQNGQAMPAGPIGYTKAPEIPQALAALLAITEQDLQDLL
ncbi:MAG: portal protein, partial [Janthinobacterium lividum]